MPVLEGKQQWPRCDSSQIYPTLCFGNARSPLNRHLQLTELCLLDKHVQMSKKISVTETFCKSGADFQFGSVYENISKPTKTSRDK